MGCLSAVIKYGRYSSTYPSATEHDRAMHELAHLPPLVTPWEVDELKSQLAEAAAVIHSAPAAMQLRYLQTLTEIAAEKNSTIIFPLPIEMLRGLSAVLNSAATQGQVESLDGAGELKEGG